MILERGFHPVIGRDYATDFGADRFELPTGMPSLRPKSGLILTSAPPRCPVGSRAWPDD
jgi:hypothetical protein